MIEIPPEELQTFLCEANSAGQFAANLVRRLFPECFGPANLRFNYNSNGGGSGRNKNWTLLCRCNYSLCL